MLSTTISMRIYRIPIQYVSLFLISFLRIVNSINHTKVTSASQGICFGESATNPEDNVHAYEKVGGFFRVRNC